MDDVVVATTTQLADDAIVAAIRQAEERHRECLSLLQKVKDGDLIALEPYSVLVEVVAAIKRRGDSTDLAARVRKDLMDISSLKFLELTSQRAGEAPN